MTVNGVDLRRVSNARNAQFHNEIDDLIVKYGAEKLKLVDLLGRYQAARKEFNDGYQKEKKSIITEKLYSTDRKRDAAVRAIREITKVHGRHFKQEVVDAANRVENALSSYGDILGMPLVDETAAINSVLDDLLGKYLLDVKAIGAEEWVLELQRLNKEFDTLGKKRNEEGVAKSDVVVKDARKKMDDLYRAIIRRVEAYIEIEGIANYTEFVKAVNLLIAQFSRSGIKNKPADETDTTDTTEPTEPIEPEEPVTEEKYPNAREWTNMVNPDDFKPGDICFVVIDGEKKYYEMIDESNFNVKPHGEEGYLGWKPVE